MIEIKNMKVYGLKESLVRSGYPMQTGEPDDMFDELFKEGFESNAILRGKSLGKASSGSGHDNFLKGVIVQFDLKYPLYFTPQLQRYNFIDIVSSQSKMHKLTSIPDVKDNCNSPVWQETIDRLNDCIKKYNATSDIDKRKQLFYEIINNTPSGFECWMGVSTNYLQLKTIYHQRKTHKLPEWHYFCAWIESLPNFYDLVLF